MQTEREQEAAIARRDLRRAIVRIAKEIGETDVRQTFHIEEMPHQGPFLSRSEAEEWIVEKGFDQEDLVHVISREASGHLETVLRFVVAYVCGDLGPSAAHDAQTSIVRDHLEKAANAVGEAMSFIDRRTL